MKIYSRIFVMVVFFLILSIIEIHLASATYIPSWVKNLFAMYKDNKISAKELNDGIAFLVQNKIIQVNVSSHSGSKSAAFSNSSASGTLVQSAPKPTISWHFDSISSDMIVGTVDLEKDANGSLINLDGQGFIQQKDNRMDNYSSLTVSAWVKPDYSQGSSKFTVISKQRAFDLSVDNDLPPAKQATFSVFDGIRWNTVQTKNPIPENWTNVVGVFDGFSIGIYVNGKLESSQPYVEPEVLVVYDSLIKPSSFVSSGNITIGAHIDNIRDKVSGEFSGSIKDVDAYDEALNSAQINQIYNNSVANISRR